MKAEIKAEDLVKFAGQYQANPENIETEKLVHKVGLQKAAQNGVRYRFKFNIETPRSKIFHQHDSYQCNIFAFLRVVRDVISQKNGKCWTVDLSANYINFYDKLEKINTLYNVLVEDGTISLDTIRQQVDYYVGNFGTFHYCREIANKYGLVPARSMPELSSQYHNALALELLRDKIKADAVELLQLKTIAQRREKRLELLNRAYETLAKIFGHPPVSFEFRGENFTPLSFKERLVDNQLENFVTVTPFDKDALLDSYAFISNSYLNDTETILHLTVDKIKDAIIKQLIGGVSVWFSAEESTAANYDEGVLDDKLYDFGNLLGMNDLSATEKLALGIINYDHAMAITGALTEKGKIGQFRVDNSFGKTGKYGGQMIMTNSFLENCVVALAIDKKFIV